MSTRERLQYQIMKMEEALTSYQTDKGKPLIEVGLKALSDLSAQEKALQAALNSFREGGMYHTGVDDVYLQTKAEKLLSAAQRELP